MDSAIGEIDCDRHDMEDGHNSIYIEDGDNWLEVEFTVSRPGRWDRSSDSPVTYEGSVVLSDCEVSTTLPMHPNTERWFKNEFEKNFGW